MLILVCNYTYVKIFILNGTNLLINQTGYKTAGWLSSRYQDNLIPFIPLLYSTLFPFFISLAIATSCKLFSPSNLIISISYIPHPLTHHLHTLSIINTLQPSIIPFIGFRLQGKPLHYSISPN